MEHIFVDLNINSNNYYFNYGKRYFLVNKTNKTINEIHEKQINKSFKLVKYRLSAGFKNIKSAYKDYTWTNTLKVN